MSADVVDTATRLYALPLDTFVEARNAAAAAARSDGDKHLAASLKALSKPSSSAWLVNVLVARRRAQVEEILELGASLRQAQAGMDRARLNALGQQRQRLIAAVARESLDAASETGHSAGAAALPGVEQTLRAALADPAAAAAVLTGRLVRTLEASGWETVDLEGAVGGPFTPPGGDDARAGSQEDAGGPPDLADPRSATRAARRLRRAEAALDAARASREAAETEAEEARRVAARTAEQRERVAASIGDLEEHLERLRSELMELEKEHAEVRRRADEAEAELVEALADEDAARTDLERPSD